MQLRNVIRLIVAGPALLGLSVAALSMPVSAEAAGMQCSGTINRARADNIRFTVPWNQRHGFEQRVNFRNARTGKEMSQSSRLRYDRKNDKGQRIYRGAVGGMADVTLINLSRSFTPRVDGQISLSLDGQWGRGTCRRR